MNNYDAGGTMDTFIEMPIEVAYTVKMVSILLSHPMELMRRMSRHGLYGYYYGILTAGIRCTVQTITSYQVFYALLEQLHNNPYLLMLRPFENDALKALGGLGGGILATPFAKLSVRRQTDLTRCSFQRHNYRSTISGIKCLYLKRGLHYLFVGWKINALCSALIGALHKPVSNRVKCFVSRFNLKDSWEPKFISMALTGCIIHVIMSPLDTLAVNALSHSRFMNLTYRAMWRRIVKKHGFWGFFFGLKPGLIGLIPNTVMATIAYRLLLT